MHLKNYYFTGLDKVTGGYVVQSIGSHYNGCYGDVSAACIGMVFVFGCGPNNDLSTV